MQKEFTRTYWYTEEELKEFLGGYVLHMEMDGRSGEIIVIDNEGIQSKKYKVKVDDRRKKPFGLNARLGKGKKNSKKKQTQQG